MKGLKLANITYEEAREAFEKYSLAVLPIGGGSKEHGPHLPCGTDFMIVEELATRIVENAPVILLPTLSYAYYPAFVDWPGSVSIEARHFMDFVSDIIKSVSRHGIKNFLILDGGVSTHPPLKIVSSDLHNKLGINVAVSNILGLGKEREEKLCEQEKGGHADEAETSNLLAVNPELVNLDKAVEEYRSYVPGTSKNGIKKIFMGRKMQTENGIHGNSTLATAEKGEEILAAQVEDIIYFIENFIKESG